MIAEDYEDDVAADPRVDRLRELMIVSEDARFSREYHEPDKRSIANTVQVFFNDGTSTESVTVEYPLGHRRRRAEGIPELEAKFRANLATCFPASRIAAIEDVVFDQAKLEALPVAQFVDLFV